MARVNIYVQNVSRQIKRFYIWSKQKPFSTIYSFTLQFVQVLDKVRKPVVATAKPKEKKPEVALEVPTDEASKEKVPPQDENRPKTKNLNSYGF